MSEEIGKLEYDRAFMAYAEIRERKHEAQKHFIAIGGLLKECRDNRYFEILDYRSFGAFLASPELSFRRSTAYGLIHIYELFVSKLGFGQDLLAMVGQAKLTMIAPVVEKSPEEWVWKAKEMSRSDLRAEIMGDNPTPWVGGHREPERGIIPPSYLDFVKSHACIVCEAKEAEAAHFPRTRGAGAKEHECIPLCRKCHSESHQIGFDTWLVQNKFQIFSYLYQTIIELYGRTTT